MYLYIYDEFAQEKKFEREMLAIENRLADLEISGKIARLTIFKGADELIRDEVKRNGIKTVVVVGNDTSVRKVLDAIVDSGVVFGLIPLGQNNNEIAEILGIPEGVAACDILSSRIIEKIDTGVMNKRRFITGVTIPKSSTNIICDNGYKLSSDVPAFIQIRNLFGGHIKKDTGNYISNPKDGRFEAVIETISKKGLFGFGSRAGRSVVGVKKIYIENDEPVLAIADGERIKSSIFNISIEPMNLSVITGHARTF